MHKRWTLLLLFFGGFIQIQAQDLHFSQWALQNQQSQAAWTGLFRGKHRFATLARNQWFSVPVPYHSFGLAFDTHLLSNRLSEDIFSLGVQFLHDQAGDAQLSSSNLLVGLAYAKRLQKPLWLCIGAQIGGGQRRLQTQNLRFDDQYDGDRYNAALVSADLANFRRSSLYYLDVNFGFGLRYQKSERSNFNLGLSIQHLNAPQQSFLDQNQALAPRLSLGFDARRMLTRTWDLGCQLHYQSQETYTQTLFGLGLYKHLSFDPGRETAVSFYVLGRNTPSNFDALVFVLGLDYQTWHFGLSYDWTTSRFATANRSYGAFELGLSYLIRDVYSPSSTKICPIL